jgi:hypothetical protein
VLYLNLVFEARHSLLDAIPAPGSLSRLFELVHTGVIEAHTSTSPAPDLAGLLLLAAGWVGICAVLTDLIAVRLRWTAVAGLPLLALVGVPSMTMNTGHDKLITGLAFCLTGAGYLTMLAVGGRASARPTGLAVAVPAGVTSIVLALFAPLLLLPQLHFSSLFSSGADADGLSLTVGQLHEPRPMVVFRYTTTASPSLRAHRGRPDGRHREQARLYDRQRERGQRFPQS